MGEAGIPARTNREKQATYQNSASVCSADPAAVAAAAAPTSSSDGESTRRIKSR